jgi:phosphatidylinositol alpha-1,6-mannosyltransferase
MKNKLNIIFVTRKWPPAIGGMETYSLELTKALRKACNLSVFKLPGKKNGMPPNLINLFLFLFSTMIKTLGKKNVDVIHIGDLFLWPIAFVFGVFSPKSKLVVTTYGLDLLYMNQKGFLPAIYKVYISLGKFLLKDRVYVTSISSATAKLSINFGFKKVFMIPLGVNLKNNYDNNKVNKNQILFVGRLVKRKGLSWFVVNVLPLLNKSFSLVVVGKEWDSSEREIIKNNKQITFLGSIANSEIKVLRQTSLVCIMPNISSYDDMEGFGIVALESASQNGVILASNIDGISDAVKNNKTGFLLPEKNAKAWAEKINEIYLWPEKLRSIFILRSRKELERNFSWRKVALKTLDIYSK